MTSQAQYRIALILYVSIASILLPASAPCQSLELTLGRSLEATLDSLAVRVAERFRGANHDESEPRVLVVDFFRNSAGSSSKLGTLLADRFADSLLAYSTGLKILDREIFGNYLTQEWTTLEDLSSSDVCFDIARQSGATGVVVGILYEDNGQMSLTLHLEGFGPPPKSADPLKFIDEGIRFPSRADLRSLPYQRGPNYARAADKIPQEPGVFVAGVNGVTNPQCIYCPQPEYSDAARATKYSATVLLSIIVTAEGQLTAP